METLGRLKTIVASLENGLELGDVPETLQWCIETIERLQKEREALRVQTERDDARAEIERLQSRIVDLEAAQESIIREVQICGRALGEARSEVERMRGILDAGKPPRSSPFHGVTPPASD